MQDDADRDTLTAGITSTVSHLVTRTVWGSGYRAVSSVSQDQCLAQIRHGVVVVYKFVHPPLIHCHQFP
jgi:hypothetical protein